MSPSQLASDDQRADGEGSEEKQTSSTLPRDFILPLCDTFKVAARSDPEAFGHLIGAVVRQIEMLSASAPPVGFDLQVAFALLPGGSRVIEVQAAPEQGAEDLVARLKSALDTMPVPPVASGPIAFVIRQRLAGGAAQPSLSFRPPFAALAVGDERITLDEALARAADAPGPNQPAAGWLEWMRRRLAGFASRRDASPTTSIAPAELARLDSPARSDLLARWEIEQSEATIEQLTSQLAASLDPRALWARSGKLLAAGQFLQAADDCTVFLERVCADAGVLARRAQARLQAENRQAALADLDTALKLDPAHPAALYARGCFFLDMEGFERAELDFRALTERMPRSPMARIRLADAMFGRKQLDGAIAALDEAIELDPHHDMAHFRRSWARIWRGAADAEGWRQVHASAIADCQRAIECNPKEANYVLWRAEIHVRQGAFAEAAKDADMALALEANNGQAFGMRGIARQNLGQFELAVEDCSRAIELSAPSAGVHLARALAQGSLGNAAAALADCEAGIALAPENAALHRCAGAALLDLGDAAEAVNSLSEAIRHEPEWPLPYMQRGIAYRTNEQYAEAMQDFDRAIELAPEVAQVYFERGWTHSAKADFKAAEADFTRAIEREAMISNTWLCRAWCRVQLNRPQEALTDLDRAIGLSPDDANALFLRGQVRTRLGDGDGAIEDFDRVIDLCPTLAPAYSGRGTVWFQKGEHHRARADFQEAIRCEPGAAEAIMIHRLLVESSTYLQQEDFDKASRRAREALELDAGCMPAHLLLGAALWYDGNFVEAVAQFTQALENQREDAFAPLSSRGQVYAELGEYDLALADLDRALAVGQAKNESQTDMAYARSGRALALAGLSRYDEAWIELEQSIRDCPENAWVQYNLGLTYHSLQRIREASICFDLALNLHDPPLPPRKRDRAAGFLRTHGKPQPESGSES